MKRAKRGAIETKNLFGTDEDLASGQSFQPISHEEQGRTDNQPSTQAQHPSPPNSNFKAQERQEEPASISSSNNGAEDERKKRLEMLRQRYLKGGKKIEGEDPNAKVEKPIQQQSKSIKTEEPQKMEPNERSQRKVVPLPIRQTVQQAIETREQIQQYQVAESEPVVRIPEKKSQRVVVVDEQKKPFTVPPPPPPKKRQVKNIPKVVPVQPLVSAQTKPSDQKHNQSGLEEIQQPKTQQIRTETEPPTEPVNILNHKVPVKSSQKYSHPQILNQQQQSPQINNTTEDPITIDDWLDSKESQASSSFSPPSDSMLLLQQNLMNQLLHLFGDNTALPGFIFNFILKNQSHLTKDQCIFVSDFLSKLEQHHHEQSLVEKSDALMIMTVKCGSQVFKKYFPHYGFKDCALKLSHYRDFLIKTERQTLINFLLENQEECSWAFLHNLLVLQPNSSQLSSFILQHQPKYPSTEAQQLQSLKLLKSHLNTENIILYLKLIQQICHNSENPQTVEKIIKQINSIQTNSVSNAYQYKKQVLRRALQRISELEQKNGSQSKTSEIQEEESKGINFMGLMSSAISKIKSTVPEKKEEIKVKVKVEEEKPAFQWNEQLGRYLINGKVPDDECDTAVNNSEERKAPPPPPPRTIKRKSDLPPPPSPVPQKNIANQEQNGELQLPEEKDEKQEEKPTPKMPYPPPPPRVGYKGVVKKPRIQPKYT